MADMLLVYVIVLVYNGKKWIDKCFRSLFFVNYPNFRVLAIDNASTDGSGEYIEKQFPQVEIIKNLENIGFAEGNNKGMRYALKKGTKYIILLNQDTTVEPNFIEELVKVAESDNKVGILSPMQYNYDGDSLDEAFSQNMRLNNEFWKDYRNGKLVAYYEIPEVIGAAMMLTKEMLLKVGLFDPIYFCYGEDTDLCSRARLKDYKAVSVTKSKIYHCHSMINPKQMPDKIKKFRLKGLFIYCLKNHNLHLVVNFINYLKELLLIIIKSKPHDLFLIFSVQIWVLKNLSLILTKRWKEKTTAPYLFIEMNNKADKLKHKDSGN